MKESKQEITIKDVSIPDEQKDVKEIRITKEITIEWWWRTWKNYNNKRNYTSKEDVKGIFKEEEDKNKLYYFFLGSKFN